MVLNSYSRHAALEVSAVRRTGGREHRRLLLVVETFRGRESYDDVLTHVP
jgi:hypothetical protein